MHPPQKSVFIFDLDDTLVLSRIDFRAVRQHLIDLLRAARATTDSPDALLSLSLPDLVARGAAASRALEVQMWEVIRVAEVDGLAGATVAPGAVAVLQELRQRGHRVALLTNTSSQGLRDQLKAWQLAACFDIIATRDDVPAMKPHPDGVLHVLAHLPPVRMAYFVGDAWIDAQAARGAAIRFIGIGDKRAAIEARGLPIWSWISRLEDLLHLEVREP